jgi:hypothetical protein
LLGRRPGAAALPDVLARMQPSDSPAASTGALVPLAIGLPRDVRFSAPAGRAYVDARRVGRFGCGSSAAPPWSWTHRGLPGYWAVPLPMCRGLLPRLGRYPLALCGGIPCCLQRQ